MKKTVYYQAPNDRLFTEREVKLMLLDKRNLRKRFLTRDEVCGKEFRFPKNSFYYGGSLDDLSIKSIRKAKVRKDLMRLGIEW